MSGWGAGLAGFASGINQGLDTGSRVNALLQEDSLAKVRAQGIAEAQAAAAAAAPKLTDNGDMQNPTANPQMSADPNAAPEPINTSLDAFISNAKERQADPAQAARGDGIKTSAVQAPDAPEAIPEDMPSSKAPDARADSGALANGDSFARAGVSPLSAPKRFNVDGQEFDNEKDARTYIGQHTPKAESFYKDTLVPKMKARLLELGRTKEAEAWDDYADRDQTRENFKTWDKARRLADFGDHNGAAEELFKLHPHYADGYDLVGTERTKGPDGSDGFTMTVKDKDGNTQKIFQNSETITRMGLPLLSPIEAFNKEYESLNKVDQARAREAVDIRDDNRRATREQANIAQRDADYERRDKLKQKEIDARQKARGEQALTVEGKKQEGRIALADKNIQARAQLAVKKLSEGGEFKKSASPEEWDHRADLAARASMDYMAAPTKEAKEAVVATYVDAQRKYHAAKPVGPAGGLPGEPAPSPFGMAAPAAPAVQAPSLSVPPPGMQSSAAPAAPVMPPAGTKPRYNPETGLVEMVAR